MTDRVWKETVFRNAITKFRRCKVRVEESGHTIDRIFIHSRLVSRGFVYIVEYLGNYYALINGYDLMEALAAMPEYETEMFREGHLYGVPITEDAEELRRVMSGLFIEAVSVGMAPERRT